MCMLVVLSRAGGISRWGDGARLKTLDRRRRVTLWNSSPQAFHGLSMFNLWTPFRICGLLRAGLGVQVPEASGWAATP